MTLCRQQSSGCLSAEIPVDPTHVRNLLRVRNNTSMKTTFAIGALLFTAAVLPMAVAEPKAQFPPGFFSATPALTVEQRFQEADINVAIAQYQKLQTAAFDIRLQLQLEPPADEKQRNELFKKADMLRIQAAELRDETIKRAAVAAVSAR